MIDNDINDLDLSRLTSEAQFDELIKHVYMNDYFLFARDICGYKDITWETHGPICEALTSASKRKLICVPRASFKSSLCSVSFPLWLLINDPNLRILIDSELYGNSKNFLREIKAHVKSEQFIKYFGDLSKNSPVWNESEIIVNTRNKPKKEASIACSGLGAEKTSTHWDVIIGDDISTTQSCATKEQAAKVIDHYRLYTSLLEPHGTIIVVGTRYSERDIIGFILQNELGCKDLNDLRSKLTDGVGEINI